MLIVDSQVHVWAAHSDERPWPADGFGREHGPVPLSEAVLLERMEEAGVARAVLVPPSWEGDRNDLALAAASAHPDRFAVMGRIDLGDAANADRLASWRQQPGMLGLRLTFLTPEQRQWLVDGTSDWVWPAAQAAGLPIMVFPPEQLAAIGRVAARHPGLKLVIDHLALSLERRGEALDSALDELLPLARHPNVAVKASALPAYSDESYPFHDLHGLVERVVDAFGPERVFWGTDLSRLPCAYDEAIRLFTQALPFLAERDIDLIMGRALCDWLGWK